MGEETEVRKAGGVMDTAKKAVLLDWLRPLVYKVGGRKMALGGAGLYVIQDVIAKGGGLGYPQAITAASIAVLCVGISWTIAKEDAA